MNFVTIETGNSFKENRLTEIIHIMDSDKIWDYEVDVKSILTILGIKDTSLEKGKLSGGMLKK